jgi:hypothetical protein
MTHATPGHLPKPHFAKFSLPNGKPWRRRSPRISRWESAPRSLRSAIATAVLLINPTSVSTMRRPPQLWTWWIRTVLPKPPSRNAHLSRSQSDVTDVDGPSAMILALVFCYCIRNRDGKASSRCKNFHPDSSVKFDRLRKQGGRPSLGAGLRCPHVVRGLRRMPFSTTQICRRTMERSRDA